MTSGRSAKTVAPLRRGFWVFTLVLLHLIVAPCATTMLLMPADADCEHCQTSNGPYACAVAAAVEASVIEGVAFDSGAADLKVTTGHASLLLPALLQVAATRTSWSRSLTTRHSGDPPLYLILGQLRI